MKDFNEQYSEKKLIDIPCCNGIYTWNNRQKDYAYIAKKLDRFFIKGNLEIDNCNIKTMILPFAGSDGSDHFPARLEFIEPQQPIRTAFKCEKCCFWILVLQKILKCGGLKVNLRVLKCVVKFQCK